MSDTVAVTVAIPVDQVRAAAERDPAALIALLAAPELCAPEWPTALPGKPT